MGKGYKIDQLALGAVGKRIRHRDALPNITAHFSERRAVQARFRTWLAVRRAMRQVTNDETIFYEVWQGVNKA